MAEPVLSCLVNGELASYLSVQDCSLATGDGVWEVIAVVNGRPWWWQDHVDRLARGCERLDLRPPDQSVLLREVQTVSVGQQRSAVRIMMVRSPDKGPFGESADGKVTRVVCAHPWPDSSPDESRIGVEARICDLRLSVQPALGGINHLSRLEWSLAARENAAHGDMEALLLDSNEHLISGIGANIFIVMAEQLLTPRMDRSGVRGIIRGRIVREFKARAELRRIGLDMLQEASEVFLCSVFRGIVPIHKIGDQRYEIGPVTREIQAWLAERIEHQ